ncbi:MAG: hypothetical protein ABSG33_06800 [Candidatus Bathyarchaeia archaeon]
MSDAELVTATLKSTPHLARLSISLSWTYFTLGWKVRKARHMFEKQLMAQGMSKKDAEEVSEFLEDFKKGITTTVKQAIASRGFG